MSGRQSRNHTQGTPRRNRARDQRGLEQQDQEATQQNFWNARSTFSGRGTPPLFDDPDILWAACCEYFEWAQKNPLQEEKIFQNNGMIVRGSANKMRAFTIEGLCLFLGISRGTWQKWGREASEQPHLRDVCERANLVIYEQKFTGAASDLLNPQIIMRDLGLAEKKELSGPEGGPIEVSPRELLAEKLSRIAAGLGAAEVLEEPEG